LLSRLEEQSQTTFYSVYPQIVQTTDRQERQQQTNNMQRASLFLLLLAVLQGWLLLATATATPETPSSLAPLGHPYTFKVSPDSQWVVSYAVPTSGTNLGYALFSTPTAGGPSIQITPAGTSTMWGTFSVPQPFFYFFICSFFFLFFSFFILFPRYTYLPPLLSLYGYFTL